MRARFLSTRLPTRLRLALPWLALACTSSSTQSPLDASIDFGSPVDVLPRDGRPTVLAVDFTVTGCPNLDLKAGVCKGAAPLTLAFVPLGSAAVSRYVWDFGDGSKSFEELPTHTFTTPGSFDVSLVGAGSSGTSRKERKGFALVSAIPAGSPCDLDGQCETGLRCICGSAARCAGPFVRGLCTRDCRSAACAAEQLCADLSPPMGASGMREAWREALCLGRCADDRDCAPSHRCRLLPARGETTWRRACFPEVPADLGSSCSSPAGTRQNDLCVGGNCADLGALGLCTLECARQPCPDGTACAALTDGRRLCLRPCTAAFTCDSDPLLACGVPGTPGPQGFTIADAPAGVKYCGPRACRTDSDCGPSGRCVDGADGGTCARRM